MKSQIGILDFGSQYTHLITRRIRQLGVLSEIFPANIDETKLEGVKGLILSGGPQSVYDETAIQYNRKLLSLDIPILGICYGHQLITHHFSGSVKPSSVKEYGFAKLEITNESELLQGLAKKETIWMSHGDKVINLPIGFETIGKTQDCPITAMHNKEKQIYGLQFHPEVTHTKNGIKIIENFIDKICHCEKKWTPEKYWEQTVEEVKANVGNKNVFLFVSGGIDSTVCYALLEKILGQDRVIGVHIDHGLLRHNESEYVKDSLEKAGFKSLKIINASKEFLEELEGVILPEEKRKIIGRLFVETRHKVMQDLNLNPNEWMLGQGTIYPDIIESGGTQNADVIKTHHNRVPEILELMKQGAIIEPLSHFYKDEVREIGKMLGIPEKLVTQHPFPGPGLAIRMLCSEGKEIIENNDEINNKLKKIVPDEYEVMELPIKSVGVQGDNRTYRHPALVIGKVDWNKLNDISISITNQVPEINRVLLLVHPDKITPEQITQKPGTVTKDRLDLLQQADYAVNSELKNDPIMQKIWQFPIVLAPIGTNNGETIILRPIESTEAMTASFYHLPKSYLEKITEKIKTIPGIDMVLFDITNKPPGTIEWE